MFVELLNDVSHQLLTETAKKAPFLSAVVAMTGTVVTAVLAVKATPKAIESLEELYSKKEEPTKWEVIKTAAPHYVATVASAAVTITSDIFLYKQYEKAESNYGTTLIAYGLLEEELLRRDEKIAEYLGKNKTKRMYEEIANDKRRDRSPMTDGTEVTFTGNGSALCYDTYSGRYFRMDKPNIQAAINLFNQDLLDDRDTNPFDERVEKEVNDLYVLLGLKKIGSGCLVVSKIIDPNGVFGSDIAENGEPCLTLDIERYIHAPAEMQRNAGIY